MAWNIPVLAFGAVKSYIDSQNAKSADEAQAAAGAEKLRLMREGAGQMSQYRQQLTPQMLQAMQNQMGAYGGARSVLSQMYGGHSEPLGGPNPSTVSSASPGMRSADSRPVMAQPRSLLRSMGSETAQQTAGPATGRQVVMPETLRRMGFGGEQPSIRGRV